MDPNRAVLIVDDDPDSRSLLVDYLGWKGLLTFEAPDGLSALYLARETQPGAVLLDLWMHPMDGWTVNRGLKADATTRHIPVIITTGSLMHGEARRAFQESCFGFAPKPLDLDAVHEMVHKAMRIGQTAGDEMRTEQILTEISSAIAPLWCSR